MLGLTLPLVDFEIPRNVVILGMITGLTYSLLGLGLTLVYRSSRVINFAHGEMGALPAVLIPIFVLNVGWPYPVVLVIALVSAATLGGLFDFLIVRPLRRASRLTVLVATIGAAQLLLFARGLLPKGGDLLGKRYPAPFDWTITIDRLVLGPGQLTILVAVPLITAALGLFLGRSWLGKASRAASENSPAARLAGIPAERVSMAVWAIAGLLAGTSAILIGPTQPLGLSAALGPQLMLRALAAAMLGGLVGFRPVFFAGVAIGLIESLVLWNYQIGGMIDLVMLATIVVSFVVRKNLGNTARGSEESSWSLAAAIRPLVPGVAAAARLRWVQAVTLGTLGLLATYLPTTMTASEQFFLSRVALFAIFGLSLVLLTGYAGQVSMGQFAFVAVGAAFGGRLYQLGLPHLPALLLATLIGGAFAILIGLPAIRIRGLFLAVITLAFSVATSGWLLHQDWLNHRGADGSSSFTLPRPVIFGVSFESMLRYYWLCLAALGVVAIFVHRFRASGPGRRLLAVRDNESSAASIAISPPATKLVGFMISGMIASFGGFLYGGLLVNFSSDIGGTFGPAESLSLVVMTVFGGVTSILGAVLGAAWIQGIPRILGSDWGFLTSGIGLLAVLLLLPGGLASLVYTARDRLVEAARDKGWLTPRETAAVEPAGPPVVSRASPHAAHHDAAPVALSAVGISVSYGGIHALRDVSIEIGRGEIVGIMGPNGAGKTTLFDVLSGHQRSNGGRVYLDGVDISGTPPQVRARRGLGRSFQQARLFEDMWLLDAVGLALERNAPSGAIGAGTLTPWARGHKRRRRDAAMGILAELELTDSAHRQIGELSTGSRRLAELACATALGAHVVLLDEPTAGLTPQEVESFSRVVVGLREHSSVSVVVVDHDVPMMRALVDRLYVLEAGELIASGPPSILDTDERVIAAYTGAEGATGFDKSGST